MDNQLLHEVAITAIIQRDDKYLITRRSKNKKRFPGYWTIPGGKLETKDYTTLDKETKDYWYNVLERTLRREVKEEVGIEIENISYLTSLATIHPGSNPSLVISCSADDLSGEVTIQESELDDYKWVNINQAKKYQLIDGIMSELCMAEEKRTKGKKGEWKRY